MSALGLWGLVSGCAGEIKDLSRILLPRKSHWEAHGKQRERKTRLRRFRAEEGKTYFVVKDHDGQQLLSRRQTWGLRRGAVAISP